MGNKRRDFLKTAMVAAGAVALGSRIDTAARIVPAGGPHISKDIAPASSLPSFKTPRCMQGMPIHATFLDEVSWDIPHANWGPSEWDRDFAHMKAMGINTVVLIRAGLGKWIAAPFESLLDKEKVMYPAG